MTRKARLRLQAQLMDGLLNDKRKAELAISVLAPDRSVPETNGQLYHNTQNAIVRNLRTGDGALFLVLIDSADFDCLQCEKDTVHDLKIKGGGVWAAAAADSWECAICHTLTPYVATRPR